PRAHRRAEPGRAGRAARARAAERAMSLFTHEPHPARVRFGEGAQEVLAEEVDRLGLARVILLASPRLAAPARARLGARVVDAIARSAMHVPVELADAACEVTTRARADGLVALGGGSTVGLAKAIALRLGLPIVAVP